MQDSKLWMCIITILSITEMVIPTVSDKHIPTTLEGPFKPVTRRFDPSLRRGSDDLPMDHPRLKKNVTSIFPEQIALAVSSPTSMWVSWATGDAQIGFNVTPLDPSTVASQVLYGKQSGKYSSMRTGFSTVYSQLYPFEGLLNYTSGIIHHVRLDGLEPGTKYFYKCGDISFPAMSQELAFETLPLPSQNMYPHRIAVLGDLGLTSNSTTTFDHLTKNDPSMIIMVGDLSYANQYLTTGGKGAPCFSCAFPDAPIRETYQPRWDGWGRFMEPLISRIPMMVIEGNHEIEPQAAGITFKSYLTRFAVPSEECGSKSNFYYSFDAAGVHFIMLGAYVDYNSTGAQYAWLKEDLYKVNRNVTPWLVAAWHSPWYNSYSSHYQEFECMRQEMEALLFQYGVDIVFSGHEHVLEMTNIAAKLKNLGMAVDDTFLVHFVLNSLPPEYGPFHVNYNTMKEKWNINELATMIIQEEGRLKQQGINSALMVTQRASKKHGKKHSKGYKKKDSNEPNKKEKKKSDRCHFCKKIGHYQKDCSKRRAWFEKKGIPYNPEHKAK